MQAADALADYATIEPFPVHPDYGDVRGFLATCEVRDRADGVTLFGRANCNYLLFPSGLLLANYGFNGDMMMARVRRQGAATIAAEIATARAELRRVLDA